MKFYKTEMKRMKIRGTENKKLENKIKERKLESR